MPIAKLSRKFYETFGDDLTTELVDYLNAVEAGYRSELRDLFEAHFGRFDAKLEQRSTALDAKLERRFAELDAKLDQQSTGLEAKLERRFTELDAKLERETAGLDAKLERTTAEIRSEIAGLDAKLEQRIAEVRREIAELRGELRAEFHKDIGSVKADLIKWNFAFWVPVALGLIGLYFKG
jgi:chromosome segregation ATPase